MPVVTCPKCPTKLRVPDDATGNAKCPKCNTLFPIVLSKVDEPKPAPPKPPAPKPAPPKSTIAPKPVITPKPPAPTPAPAPNPFAGFEVVDEDEPPPPKSTAKAKAVPPKPEPQPPAEDEKPKKKKSLFTRDDDEEPPPREDDEEVEKPKKKKPLFEVEDEEEERPRSKRRRDEDEEEERPRKKSRWAEDDDDEDDRPRSKRRRDYDDDDDDDRPRNKRRRDYDDDEDDEDWHQAPKKKGPPGFANAKTGVLLLNISFWLYGVSLALITFFIFLGLVGAFDGSSSSSSSTSSRRTPPQRGNFQRDDDFNSSRSSNTSSAEFLVKLPGILGVGNWILAGIGFGFCIAGPVKARAMAITATSLAGAHILLLGVSINDVGSSFGGFGSMGAGDAAVWLLGATTLPILDTLIPIVIYGVTEVIRGTYILVFLAAGCELARMIFAMLMVKRIAEAAKDYEAAEKAQMGVVGAAIAGGGSVIVALGLTLLAKAGAITGETSAKFLGGGSILLIFAAFTLMNAMPIFSTLGLWKTLGRKTRGK